MASILKALGIQLGTNLVGAGINRLLNRRPDVPNISARTYGEYARRRRDLEEFLGRGQDRIEEDMAAAGLTGSAGASQRAALFDRASDAQVDLLAEQSDAVARAENQEEQMRYADEMGQYQNRAQAIGNISGIGGQALALRYLGDEYFAEKYGMEPDDVEAVRGGMLIDSVPTSAPSEAEGDEEVEASGTRGFVLDTYLNNFG
jgi:hypothetical protein